MSDNRRLFGNVFLLGKFVLFCDIFINSSFIYFGYNTGFITDDEELGTWTNTVQSLDRWEYTVQPSDSWTITVLTMTVSHALQYPWTAGHALYYPWTVGQKTTQSLDSLM